MVYEICSTFAAGGGEMVYDIGENIRGKKKKLQRQRKVEKNENDP